MNTRDQNKQLRRMRILDAARKILVDDGYDALTTRGLAEAAGVTAPTIYNLIGGKEDVLKALIAAEVERASAQMIIPTGRSTLDLAEDFIDASTCQVSEDEDSIRATLIASDRVFGFHAPGHEAPADVPSPGLLAIDMATRMVKALQESGVLLGNVIAETLGEQIFTCFRDPLRDWTYGLISLDEYRRRLARGVYMVLCCDAADTTRRQLVTRINALNSETGSHAQRAAPGR